MERWRLDCYAKMGWALSQAEERGLWGVALSLMCRSTFTNPNPTFFPDCHRYVVPITQKAVFEQKNYKQRLQYCLAGITNYDAGAR